METATRRKIRSALRKLWLYSPERRQALKRNYALGKMYFCNMCAFPTPQPQIDHIEPVGPSPGSRASNGGETWDGVINRLFCPSEGLQVVCRECHKLKTLGKLPPLFSDEQMTKNRDSLLHRKTKCEKA